MNLKPEIKSKWIAALESSMFTQGRNVLRSEDKDGNLTHCCLGVLCELAIRDGVEGTWENRNGVSVFITPVDKNDPYFSEEEPYNEDVYLLPDAVVEWSGLGVNSPLLPEGFANPHENLISLANLNDRSTDFSAVVEAIKAL